TVHASPPVACAHIPLPPMPPVMFKSPPLAVPPAPPEPFEFNPPLPPVPPFAVEVAKPVPKLEVPPVPPLPPELPPPPPPPHTSTTKKRVSDGSASEPGAPVVNTGAAPAEPVKLTVTF